ncbi:hypothetical protein F0L74_30650 [Chitinophaga agrisoli]|uniref:Uncharacterized protein n=1 Tax=Chitinophaga agrisoli TaxID=2607653 RepID=A0A5B2VNZ2_9BACT|nr:hypothetical protein [Chitinophaga agrisoli]KAA2240514.1 hypothetical protein F0L74_30650 [Chitinophaga agrisoli]
MNATIIVALISSFAAILIGIANFISARITLRHNKATVLELERLKDELDRKKQARLFAVKQAEKEIDAIDRAISCIQRLKETLYLAITCLPDTVSTEVIIAALKLDIEKLVTLYEDDFSMLKSVTKQSVHDIKTFSADALFLLKSYLNNATYVSLSDEQKNTLAHKRSRLTEQQEVLRDIKYNIITRIAS